MAPSISSSCAVSRNTRATSRFSISFLSQRSAPLQAGPFEIYRTIQRRYRIFEKPFGARLQPRRQESKNEAALTAEDQLTLANEDPISPECRQKSAARRSTHPTR